MSIRALKLRTLLLGMLFFAMPIAKAAPGLVLYTPSTKISVPPGQSIEYLVDVIYNGGGVANAELSLEGLPKDWNYELKFGGWNVKQIAVLSGEKKTVIFRLNIPFSVKKGAYRFNMVAAGMYTLPLTVIVSEEGTSKTELTSRQPNMRGNSKATFTFSAELRNHTGESQLYGLVANVPQGWNASFSAAGRPVTSAPVESNAVENITLEIDPPDFVTAGTYKIPVSAMNSKTSASLEVEVVVTGSFQLELVTPTGLLSTNIIAGEEKKIELVVKNTGSAEIRDIKLIANAPVNWTAEFDPKSIESLAPGGLLKVSAKVKADKEAIPGDYLAGMEARSPEVQANVSYRFSVKTSMVYGWIGVLIIFGALGSVYYLFRKYGRR